MLEVRPLLPLFAVVLATSSCGERSPVVESTNTSAAATAPPTPVGDPPGPGEPAIALDLDLTIDRAAFAPDGKRLATSSESAVVWDLATGLPGPVLPGDSNGSSGLVWSPDGTRLAFAGHGEVRIFDPANSKPIARLGVPGVVGLAWRSDGKSFRVASSDGAIVVAAAADATVEATIRPPGSKLMLAAWTPDGTKIAAVLGDDERTVLLDGVTGAELSAFAAPAAVPLALEFDPTGARLLGVYNSAADVHVWGVGGEATGVVHRIEGTSRIEHAAWSPDGTRIAVAGSDGVARVIDATSGNVVASIGAEPRVIEQVAWSPDGASLALAALYASVWGTAKQTETQRLVGYAPKQAQLACAPDGVLRWSADFGLTHWDLPTLAATSHGGIVELRKLRANDDARLQDSVAAIRPNPTKDGAVLLWTSGLLESIGDGALPPARMLPGARDAELWSLSPDQTKVAAVAGTALSIWSLESGHRDLHREMGLTIRSQPVWAPDGTLLALSSPTDVRIVDAREGETRVSLTLAPLGSEIYSPTAYAMVFSPDGKRLAIDNGEHIDLIDLATRKVTKTLPASPRATIWTRDGALVGPRGTMITIDSASIATIPEPTSSGDLCAADDGRWVVAASPTGIRVRRSDGTILDIARVLVGGRWQTAAVSSDGFFDGDADAIARLRVPRGERPVPFADVLERREGLVAGFLPR